MSIEADANQDLALDDEDAENVIGGQHKTKKAVKPAAAAPAEIDTTVQASGGGWQPVVDDPSEDC